MDIYTNDTKYVAKHAISLQPLVPERLFKNNTIHKLRYRRAMPIQNMWKPLS